MNLNDKLRPHLDAPIQILSVREQSLCRLFDYGNTCYQHNIGYAFNGDNVLPSYVIGHISDTFYIGEKTTPVVIGIINPASEIAVSRFRDFVEFRQYHERMRRKKYDTGETVPEGINNISYYASISQSIEYYARRVEFLDHFGKFYKKNEDK